MQSLTRDQMAAVEGEGFWGGVGCGLGMTGALISIVSPDPISKFALLTYSSAAIGCFTAFRR